MEGYSACNRQSACRAYALKLRRADWPDASKNFLKEEARTRASPAPGGSRPPEFFRTPTKKSGATRVWLAAESAERTFPDR
jgi:hypothetical protein